MAFLNSPYESRYTPSAIKHHRQSNSSHYITEQSSSSATSSAHLSYMHYHTLSQEKSAASEIRGLTRNQRYESVLSNVSGPTTSSHEYRQSRSVDNNNNASDKENRSYLSNALHAVISPNGSTASPSKKLPLSPSKKVDLSSTIEVSVTPATATVETANSESEEKKTTPTAPPPPPVPCQKAELKGRKTLVLDLDETLIHSSTTKPDRFDLEFKITVRNRSQEFYLILRPGVTEFLRFVSKHYEVFVWTASIQEYASVVMNEIDPEHEYISHALYRESCKLVNGSYVKDLSMLNRNLKDTIIIDNLRSSFKLESENGILIEDFIDDANDRHLPDLEPFLAFLAGVNDVRDVSQWKDHFNSGEPFYYESIKGDLYMYTCSKEKQSNQSQSQQQQQQQRAISKSVHHQSEDTASMAIKETISEISYPKNQNNSEEEKTLTQEEGEDDGICYRSVGRSPEKKENEEVKSAVSSGNPPQSTANNDKQKVLLHLPLIGETKRDQDANKELSLAISEPQQQVSYKSPMIPALFTQEPATSTIISSNPTPRFSSEDQEQQELSPTQVTLPVVMISSPASPSTVAVRYDNPQQQSESESLKPQQMTEKENELISTTTASPSRIRSERMDELISMQRKRIVTQTAESTTASISSLQWSPVRQRNQDDDLLHQHHRRVESSELQFESPQKESSHSDSSSENGSHSQQLNEEEEEHLSSATRMNQNYPTNYSNNNTNNNNSGARFLELPYEPLPSASSSIQSPSKMHSINNPISSDSVYSSPYEASTRTHLLESSRQYTADRSYSSINHNLNTMSSGANISNNSSRLPSSDTLRLQRIHSTSLYSESPKTIASTSTSEVQTNTIRVSPEKQRSISLAKSAEVLDSNRITTQEDGQYLSPHRCTSVIDELLSLTPTSPMKSNSSNAAGLNMHHLLNRSIRTPNTAIGNSTSDRLNTRDSSVGENNRSSSSSSSNNDSTSNNMHSRSGLNTIVKEMSAATPCFYEYAVRTSNNPSSTGSSGLSSAASALRTSSSLSSQAESESAVAEESSAEYSKYLLGSYAPQETQQSAVSSLLSEVEYHQSETSRLSSYTPFDRVFHLI